MWRIKVCEKTGYIAACHGMMVSDSLAVLSGDGVVMANVAMPEGHFQERAHEVAWSPDGTLLAVMVHKRGLAVFGS